MPRLTLIGYRGTGKSTVARLVADRLGCGWRDADDVFERETGSTIADHFREHGEPSFRDLEATILRRLLADDESGVIATGGGVVLREENRRLLRQFGRPVLWLDAPAEVILARLVGDPATAKGRPPLSAAGVLAEVPAILASREPLYAATADLRIDVRGTPQEVADRIGGALVRLGAAGGAA
jgi:shikimate kinase